ncbi:MAG TPA: glycosyltransferase family 4 protein [Gemmatimonadales bacterium]|nr:glycosyltransferase family 4 protein [Gemmatimonadales bacterium]
MAGPRPRLLFITSEWPVLKPKQPQPNTVKQRAEALQAAGVSVEVFTFSAGTAYGYLAAWTRLRPRLHPRRYDLVHAQDTSNVLLALPKRVPLVVTLGTRDLRRVIQHLFTRFLARRADAVIVGSDEMRDRIRLRTPVYVIPPGLDEGTFTARLLDVYRSLVPERFSAS